MANEPIVISLSLSIGLVDKAALLKYKGARVIDLIVLCKEVLGIMHFIGKEIVVKLKLP